MQVNRLFEIVYLLLERREMTAKELAAHFEVSSRTILRAVQVPETDKVLSKLGAIFNKNAASWIDIDFSPWDSASGERDKFSVLRDAILARTLVCFDYYSYFGEKTSRTAEPLQIVFKEKAWYLSAFCRERDDYRTFKLSRMKRLAVSDETFAPRALRPVTGIIAPQNLCTVTLRMSEEAYCRMGAEFAEEKVTENEDGSFTLTTLLPDDEWGYGYPMSTT